jgi:hypothetical protein
MERPIVLDDGTIVYKCYATIWANEEFQLFPDTEPIPAADNLEWKVEIKS